MLTMAGLVDVVLLLVLYIFSVDSVKLPSYLKPCSLSDPNFNECCLKHGKEAVPYFVRGDRKFNIPNLSPLFLPQLHVDAPGNLRITMMDMYVYGLEKARIEQIRFDVEEMKVTFKISIHNLQLIGKYEMTGRILILPIQGKGDVNVTAIDGEYQYDFEYTLRKKGNHSYIDIKDTDKLTFELKDAKIKLDNLFNGDETLGKLMNTFINDNWKEVLKEIGGAVRETIRSVSKTILTGYTSKVPYDQFFLK